MYAPQVVYHVTDKLLIHNKNMTKNGEKTNSSNIFFFQIQISIQVRKTFFF